MIGEVFERRLRLSMEEIAEFAHAVGDRNPIHHDLEQARASRFGNIVASEPQVSSLFMAMVATYFCQNRAILGLEFNFRFIAPIFPMMDIKMRWEVVDVEPKPVTQSELVTLAGRITNRRGETLVEGDGKAMLMEKL
jgi:3-hydroxybutyryl-CoA dehydratase